MLGGRALRLVTPHAIPGGLVMCGRGAGAGTGDPVVCQRTSYGHRSLSRVWRNWSAWRGVGLGPVRDPPGATGADVYEQGCAGRWVKVGWSETGRARSEERRVGKEWR